MDERFEEWVRQAAAIHLTDEESARVFAQMQAKMKVSDVSPAADECLIEQMEDIHPTFVTSAKKARLTEREAAMVSAKLQAFMEKHPVDMEAALRKNEQSQHAFIRLWEALRFRSAPALVAVVVLVGAGAGVSYAAESAIPGDALYGFKVHVNEPVLAAIALTPQAKASVNVEIANRRVREAEALAARGRLTSGATLQLMSDFDAHIAIAQQEIGSVSAAGDAQAASSLSVNVEQTLHEHSKNLRTLAYNHSDENDHDIAEVLRRVEHAAGSGSFSTSESSTEDSSQSSEIVKISGLWKKGKHGEDTVTGASVANTTFTVHSNHEHRGNKDDEATSVDASGATSMEASSQSSTSSGSSDATPPHQNKGILQWWQNRTNNKKDGQSSDNHHHSRSSSVQDGTDDSSSSVSDSQATSSASSEEHDGHKWNWNSSTSTSGSLINLPSTSASSLSLP